MSQNWRIFFPQKIHRNQNCEFWDMATLPKSPIPCWMGKKNWVRPLAGSRFLLHRSMIQVWVTILGLKCLQRGKRRNMKGNKVARTNHPQKVAIHFLSPSLPLKYSFFNLDGFHFNIEVLRSHDFRTPWVFVTWGISNMFPVNTFQSSRIQLQLPRPTSSA